MILQTRVSDARKPLAPGEPPLPRVHVVGPRHGGLTTALVEALRRNVRLVECERAPGPSAVAVNELVIVDLTATHSPVQPQTVTALLDRVEVWLAVGVAPVDPGWVDRARHARVRVIRVGTGGAGHLYDALISGLLERYRWPTCQIDAVRILTLEPSLRPAEPYVAVLCAHPWLVRRPRDLADVAHTSLRTLKLDCLALGFTRIEHFIIYVRAIAYEQLVARGLSSRDARRLSGFSDPSNMRRHLRRAMRRSPDALARRTMA